MEIIMYGLFGLAAIVPAAFFVFYIVAYDRYKPEPVSALVVSVLLGMFAAVVLICVGKPYEWGELVIGPDYSWQEAIEIGLMKLALPAEITKWLMLCLFCSLNKYYDEFIDGAVYSVCLAMGFAGIWGTYLLTDLVNGNVDNPLGIVVMTALLLIPMHMMAGTVMGYFIAQVKKKKRIVNNMLALVLPVLVNATICFLAMMIVNNWIFFLVMDVLLAVLGILFYVQIYRLLKNDGIRMKRM